MSNHAEINDVADRFFKAIERQDAETLRGIYSEDALIWKNYNRIAISAQASLAFLGRVAEYLQDVTYQNVRRHLFDGGFVQHHDFTGTVRATGEPLAFPVCLVALVSDGEITRIDEYLDSADRLPITA